MDEETRIWVLLVEDNPRTAGLAMEFLSAGLSEGPNPVPVDVLRCSDLAAAKRALKDSSFDACVLDLNLPDSSGVDTVRAVHEAAPNVPIVVLSANDDPEVTGQLAQAGAEGFVSKWLQQPLELTKQILSLLIKRGDALADPLARNVRARLDEHEN